MLEKIILKQIPQHELIKGEWYLGRGRNSNVGIWIGDSFLTFGYTFHEPAIKGEDYYEEKGGCFQPFLLVDNELGRIKTSKIIPKASLLEKWYVGNTGQTNACNVALWDSRRKAFLTFDFDSKELKAFEARIRVIEYSVFRPLKAIEEGKMVETFGEIGWNKHYGKKLQIKIK